MNLTFREFCVVTVFAFSAATASAGTVGALDGVSIDSTFENVGTFGGSVAVSTGAYGWTDLNSTARAFRDAVEINNAALISLSNATGAFEVQFDTHVAIQAATTYQLSVDLGFMTPPGNRTAPYAIELGVLDRSGLFTSLASSNGVAQMTQHFGDGASLTVNTSYLSGATDAGDLTVRLSRLDGGTDGRWLGFDNVVLTAAAAPVPEPATAGMLCLGLAALVLMNARSRRKQG